MFGSMPAPELPLPPIFRRLCVFAAEPEGQQSEKTDEGQNMAFQEANCI